MATVVTAVVTMLQSGMVMDMGIDALTMAVLDMGMDVDTMVVMDVVMVMDTADVTDITDEEPSVAIPYNSVC